MSPGPAIFGKRSSWPLGDSAVSDNGRIRRTDMAWERPIKHFDCADAQN